MSDITLTNGIRQNLLSLQETSADLTTTQEALATGKAVNSPVDNPSAYFTSQNLTDTANSLTALLDQIGQGSQTINAATNGLTGLTSLLQQALSTVQQAQSSNWTTAGSTTGSSVAANATTGTTIASGTLTIDVGSSTYNVSIAQSSSLAAIEADINNTTGLGAAGAVSATDNGSQLILTSTSAPTGFTVVDTTAAETLGLTTAGNNTVVNGQSATRSTLQANYNALLTQINQLAGDSGYNGINLLNGDNLTIDFNPTGTSSLTITGVTYNAAGLGLDASTATATTRRSRTIPFSPTRSPPSTPRSQTCKPRPRRSVPTRRPSRPGRRSQTAMINTLQTGASNLVAADQNQESADLLTEQTQQQLEISALSIANQANQSVLKLFG